jgi:Mrp family chromosome partitioning ATPase
MSRYYELLRRAEQELAEASSKGVPTSASPVAAQNETTVDEARPIDVQTPASPVAPQKETSVGEALPAGVPTPPARPSPAAAESQSSCTPSTVEWLLAQCPRLTWRPDPRALLVIHSDEDVLGAEEFRTLRSFLYLVREQRKLRRLLISSPLPREGKTFTALNLAHAIACQPQHRALLID